MPKYKGKRKPEGESKPNYYEGNDSRADSESKEGLAVVHNDDAPANRYDQSQQVSDVADAQHVSPPQTGFQKRETKAGGSTVKQEVASKVLLADSDYAGIPGGVTASATRNGLQSMSYSGDAGSILGTAANTPVVGTPSRSEGRFDRKLDAATKKIDFLASEQVVTEYFAPKALGESGSEVQGYYGTPKNTSVRSQKSAGGTPANLLVERSADEILRDELIFVNGQYVRSTSNNGPAYGVEPTKVSTFTNGIRSTTSLTSDDIITYGNWLNRTMTVKITKADPEEAYVSAISFTSVDCTSSEEAAVANAASTNWIIDMNRDEIARQMIDSKAGRETEPNWSPLGRAVLEPTATVGLLSRLESDTGASVYAAYHFAMKSFSYQLNKAAKDGQRTTTPMIEAVIGDIAPALSSEDYDSTSAYYVGTDTIFNEEAYVNGAASLLIALFDSPRKYSTKADLLVQPRGLRRAFQTADNNMDVFRVKREFVAALNNRDVFSTIDRDYDPLLPICVTDRVGLISPISYARFGNFTRSSSSAPRVYDYKRFTYAYSNRSSNYVIEVGHPLLDGVADFFEQHASKIYDICKSQAEDGVVTLNIPIHNSTTTFSLWSFLVLYAVPYIQKRRINSMRDVLDFEVNFEYPFTLETIGSLNPKNAVNYSMESIDSPLQARRMIASTAISWIMPEFFWGVGGTSSSAQYMVMPWYFSELQFNPGVADRNAASGYEMEYMSGAMSMPVVRNGVRLALLDDMYSMSERDIRLCLDRMVRPPMGDSSANAAYNVYKYGQANDGIPCISGSITTLQLLSTPRELGWFMVAPYAALRAPYHLKSGFGKSAWGTLGAMNEQVGGNTSYQLRCWTGTTSVTSEILTASDVKIDRAQAFRQYWDISPACALAGFGVTSGALRARRDVGFLVSLRHCFSNSGVDSLSVAQNQGYFVPFTVGYMSNSSSIQAQTSNTTEFSVLALHKGLWGRIQRLPMILSPWDTCDYLPTEQNGANYDPYDFAYAFGLAGFMASDYNQDLYNRTNRVQDQGWLYTTDPFVADSPVFKDSIKYTMR